jgi:hypothetical protein
MSDIEVKTNIRGKGQAVFEKHLTENVARLQENYRALLRGSTVRSGAEFERQQLKVATTTVNTGLQSLLDQVHQLRMHFILSREANDEENDEGLGMDI